MIFSKSIIVRPTLLLIFSLLLNTGSSFAADLFWVGGSGNWNDVSHWSASSGGGSCGCLPTAVDDVYFDAASFNLPGETVTVNVAATVHHFDWSGIDETVTLAGFLGIDIYGSLAYSALMTVTNGAEMEFKSTSGLQTVDFAGVSIDHNIRFNGSGGNWSLQDSINSVDYIYIQQGALITNDYPLRCSNFYSNYSTSSLLISGNSKITLTGTSTVWSVSNTNFFMVEGNTEIKCTNNNINFFGEQLTYNHVIFLQKVNLYDNSHFGTLEFRGDAKIHEKPVVNDLVLEPGGEYEFANASELTINGILTANGSCAAQISLFATSASSATVPRIVKSSGVVSTSYCRINAVDAVGGATFQAANSVVNNATGWVNTLPSAETLYWVGGSGDWNDPSHWALSSGGAGGTCVPDYRDAAVFDLNSFPAGGTVTVSDRAVCNDLIWSGVSNIPSLEVANFVGFLDVYGSLTLDPSMVIDNEGEIRMRAATGTKSVTCAGLNIGDVRFDGTAIWIFSDYFNADYLYHQRGTINTGSNDLEMNGYRANFDNPRTLLLGSSTMTLRSFSTSFEWLLESDAYVLDAGTSHIICEGNGYSIYGNGISFYDISFTGSSGSVFTIDAARRINFSGTGSISSVGPVQSVTSLGNLNSSGTIAADSILASANYTSTTSTSSVNYLNVAGTASLNGTAHYQHAILQADGSLNSAQTFDNLTLSPGATYTLQGGQTTVINSSLSATGNCAEFITLQSSTLTPHMIQKAGGTVTVDFASLSGITGAGGATFNAINSSDGGNNSGWNITSPAGTTLYWVGGSGNWNDPMHWSSSSGGAPGICLPTRADDVVFDANSFSAGGQQVLINAAAYCADMTWTGVTDNPEFEISGTSGELRISGSLQFDPNMIADVQEEIYFEADAGLHTLTLSGHMLDYVYFDGMAGWGLLDTFRANYIYHLKGALKTLGRPVFVKGYNSNTKNLRLLDLGSSRLTIQSATSSLEWVLDVENFVFKAGSSRIICEGSSYAIYGDDLDFNEIQFLGNGSLVYTVGSVQLVIFDGSSGSISNADYVGSVQAANNLTISGTSQVDQADVGSVYSGSGDVTVGVLNVGGTATFFNKGNYGIVNLADNAVINDEQTFAELYLSSGKTYTFESNTTTRVTDVLDGAGSCSEVITLQQSSILPAELECDSGLINLDFASVTGITAVGAAPFLVTNASDGGNNLGWTFIEPNTRTFYWVGGAGDFNDINHWADSSGGVPQVCLPLRSDDVVFDANSFDIAGGTVLIDEANDCRSMIWEGLIGDPVLQISGTSGELHIYGSLQLDSTMSVNITEEIYFEADTGFNEIFCGGQVLDDVYFSGEGYWTLLDTFTATAVFHQNGTWNTAGFTVDISRYNSNYTNPRVLILDTTNFFMSYTNALAWSINTTNFTLDAGQSNLRFSGSSFPALNGLGLTFYEATFTGVNGSLYNLDTVFKVSFLNPAVTSSISSFKHIGELEIANNGSISGSGTVGKLTTAGDMTFSGSVRYNSVVLNGDASFNNRDRFSNLTFTPGRDYLIGANDSLIIDNFLFADGTAAERILLYSTSALSPGKLRKNTGDLCIDFINLENITAVGGANFNAGASSVDLGGNSGWSFTSCVYSCGQVTSMFITSLGTTVATLNFDPVEGGLDYLVRVREVGTVPWTTFPIGPNETPAVNLTGLTTGTSYEWQVKTYCNESKTLESLWTASQVFTPTCVAPVGQFVNPILTTAARLNWIKVPGGIRYEVRGRKLGNPNWASLFVNDGNNERIDVNVLQPATTYEWQIRTACNSAGTFLSPFSPSDTFTTGIIPTPLACVVDLGGDTLTVCGTDTLLDAGPGFQLYLWSTGETTQTITVNTSGDYWVKTTWEYCNTGDTTYVDFPMSGCAKMNASAWNGAVFELEIFPNPASDYLVLRVPDGVPEKIFIADLSGRIVQRFLPANADYQTLSLADFVSGIYIVQVDSKNNSYRAKLSVVK